MHGSIRSCQQQQLKETSLLRYFSSPLFYVSRSLSESNSIANRPLRIRPLQLQYAAFRNMYDGEFRSRFPLNRELSCCCNWLSNMFLDSIQLLTLLEPILISHPRMTISSHPWSHAAEPIWWVLQFGTPTLPAIDFDTTTIPSSNKFRPGPLLYRLGGLLQRPWPSQCTDSHVLSGPASSLLDLLLILRLHLSLWIAILFFLA